MLNIFRLSIVLFFSFILILSIYSNISNYTNAQIIIVDDVQNDKNTIYGKLFYPPPTITRCERTDGITDFGYYGYASYFGIPSAIRDNGVSDGQGITQFAQTTIYVVGPPIDDDNNLDTVLISPNIPGKKNLAPETTYTLIYDQCQDGYFNPRSPEGDGDVFADKSRDFFVYSVNGNHHPYVFWNLKLEAQKRASGFFVGEYEKAIERGLQIMAWLAGIATMSGIIILIVDPNPGTATKAIAIISALISFTDDIMGPIVSAMIGQSIGALRKWSSIASDPPDPNYRILPSLDGSLFNIKKFPMLSNSTSKLFDVLDTYNQESAILKPLLESIERYQGALLEDNVYWATIQLNKTKEYINMLQDHTQKIDNDLVDIKETIINDKLVFPDSFTEQQLSIFNKTIEKFNHVSALGFNSTDLKNLKNIGLDDQEIAKLETSIKEVGSIPLRPKEVLLNLVDNLTKQNIEFKTNLDKISKEIESSVISTMSNNPDLPFSRNPAANAGGPYEGNIGESILFVSNTPDNSNTLTYSWDLDGDGLFNDGSGKNASWIYNQAITGNIALMVTNSYGDKSIGYSELNIKSEDSSPIVDFAPKYSNILMNLTNSVKFKINISDLHDYDIKWILDNSTVLTGTNTFDFMPTVNELGSHLIRANVLQASDQNSIIDSVYWIVTVLGNDNDRDGWFHPFDCNDNNSNINPGTTEIHYNNIDDDCNPTTLDNNTSPTIQNVTFETNQNQRTTIELSSADIDDDVINFAIVDRPVNGTLGNIVVTKETNYVGRATYTPNNNFHGIDHFTFIANDGKENSSVGGADINVGINESPIAQSQDIEINEDSTIKIMLKATNPDGHPLTFSIPSFDVGKNQGKTNFGILKDLKQTGPFTAEVTYSPIADYNSEVQNAQDSFVFEVRDGLSVPGFDGREKSVATVSINVKNVNDSPNTVNQNIHTKSNTSIIIDLKGTDVENDAVVVRDHFNHGLQFSIVEPPSHGILSNINQIIQVNRSPPLLDSTRDQVTYTPQNNFVGKDSFTFIASDGLSSSSFGNITITVQDPNTVIQRTEFEEGDIIIGTSSSGFQWYDSEGNYIKDLQSILGSWGGTGGAFDSEGNLYVTHFDPFSLTGVSKYAKNGNFIERWHDRNDFGCLPQGTPHTGYECMAPESIVIDKQDNIFVGGVARAEGDDEGGEFLTGDHRDDIRKFNSDGVLLDSFDVKVEDRGSDWTELDPNQCTMYYTSEDKNILRYDVCDDKQLSNFANTYDVGRILETSKKINYALRLLPTGEFLVASNTEIWKLDSQGSLMQKYDAPGENTWFALNISPDGKSFWSASLDSPTIYNFDIQTGKILNYFNIPQDGISGIIIKGEPTLSSNNFPPIVFNQTGIINGNVPTLINLTGFDIANDSLTFNIIKETNSGMLGHISHISNNVTQVVYTPNLNFSGTDSFTFNANDGKLNSTNTGTITITRNHAPIANDDRGITTFQGIPINITILANDTDTDIGNPMIDDIIQITNIDTSNTLGNVTLNSDNTTINYVPFAPQYIGPDSFNYTISDRYVLKDTAQVEIKILSTNHIPVAQNQFLFTQENTAKTIQLVATDEDSNDQSKLVYKIAGGPQNGYISGFNSTTGIVQYNPLKAFHGQDSFTFKVHDGKDKSNMAYVNITVTNDLINDRPQVTSERVSANISQPITINILANDMDPNDDFLTLTNFTGPFNGTAFLNPDQTITYQSEPDFNASDVLYYRVADSLGAYGIGQLIIKVNGNSLTQTIEVPDSVNVVTAKNTPVDIELIATSLIKRPLNFYIDSQSADGILSNFVMTADDTANVTYTPNNEFVGDDSFTYKATDPQSGTVSNNGTINIIVQGEITNNPPVAKDKQISVDEEQSIEIQLNATDPDTDNSKNVITYEITTQPTSGQITDFDEDTGIMIYTPYDNFNGQDSFTFKAQDNGDPELDSNVAVLSITVNPVNDAPVAVDDRIVVDEDTSPAGMIPVLANDTDVDIAYEGDALSVSSITVNSTHGNASISSDRQSILYSPSSQYSGPDSLKYIVSDKDNAISENQATVSITVNPVNDPPFAKDLQVQTDKDTLLPIQLQGTDPDSGDSISSYLIVNQPTNGSISGFDSAAGTLTYTSNTGFVGDDSFTFKVVDSNNVESSNTGTIFISVKDVIEPPPDTVPPGYTAPMSSSLCLDSANENTKGTQNDDSLVGSAGKETINGLGGKDSINACSGNDTINGNSGNDGINGDAGNDKIHGNEGKDYLLGGDGDDELFGNQGDDILKGGDGDDDLFGNQGDDILTGGEGEDRFVCGSGNDEITDFKETEGDIKTKDCEEF